MNSKKIKVKRMGGRRGNNTQLYLAEFRSPWKQWTETLKTLASGFCFLLYVGRKVVQKVPHRVFSVGKRGPTYNDEMFYHPI